MCPGIQMNRIVFPFFSIKNVSSCISFVISLGFWVFEMAVKLLSESQSIINFVLLLV